MNPRQIRLRAAVAAAIALPLACLVHPAGAQTAAPATPVAMAKPNCGEKPEHPGRLASVRQKNQWVKEANTYLECLRKFAEDQRALVEQYRVAANAAIQAHTDAVQDIKAQAEANAD